MTAQVHVDIQIASDSQQLPETTDIERWASAAVGIHRDEAEVSVRIVDVEEGTELNQQWRMKDGPTNVLIVPI